MSTPVINPSEGWDEIPVHASYQVWRDKPDHGKIRFSALQRVTYAPTGQPPRTIYAGGPVSEITIGKTDEQDPTVRAMVRAAMRAADEARPGFDGMAWDIWWDTVYVPSAIFTSFPASDDPNISPQGWTIMAKETLQSGKGREYAVPLHLSMLDNEVPGLNLATVEVPSGSPTVPAPSTAKGQPGGLASLDYQGKVPASQLPDGFEGLPDAEDGQFLARVAGEWTGVEPPTGGVSSWDDLADKPPVIAAGANAANARAAIEAVGSSDSRLSDARTPTTHEHPAADLSDSTTVGRSVLTATSAASARSAIGVVDATVSAKGLVELATTAETQDGTDTARAVTPAGMAAAALTKRPGASGRFGGVYATEGDIPTGSLGPGDVGTWFVVMGS
ncbi:MAG: hypothetical protein IPJ61_17530 [Tessaracoccus sp.]|uniref:hypothetical protein n=1 Tax=Tessaracoccus sp. TaxID=1971211 RepID=UPI001EBEF582|nr:hypothetical protein [Tessaracoccus sp.]MBK7822808.1 hypothetical protein [Tessaracoccus sp.]